MYGESDVYILCFQRNHPAIHKSLYKPRQKAAASGDVQPSVSPMLGPVDKKWKPTDARQVQLTSRLVSFVAHDLMPLSVVDSTAFREFVFEGTPAFVIPSRKHLSYTLLPQRAEQVRVDLKRRMHIADVVYLTVDLWSSRDMRSFIGITGHFVNDFVLQTVMVACKRFHGLHTGERIHQVFEETLTTYGLLGKVSAVVTDNAANMVKAFTLPGLETIAESDRDEVDGEILQPDSTDDLDDLVYERISCFIYN